MEKTCGHPRQLAEESSVGKETKMVEDFFAGDWEKKYLPQILTFYQIQIFNEQKSFFLHDIHTNITIITSSFFPKKAFPTQLH